MYNLIYFIVQNVFRIIRAARIQVKEDTVSYRASAFLDGSEQKVEDLLRKLPGIQVEADGQVKYKGKFIEKVLLEGDDLFDLNYTIGTKNMNVDIIDQVQAIENYSENSLRSEEHTSELQSRGHLVCRLLLEKKKSHIFDSNL